MIIVLYIVAALVSLAALYLVIRLAVTHALHSQTLWERGGGVEKAQQRRAAQRAPVPAARTRTLNSAAAWWDKEPPKA